MLINLLRFFQRKFNGGGSVIGNNRQQAIKTKKKEIKTKTGSFPRERGGLNNTSQTNVMGKGTENKYPTDCKEYQRPAEVRYKKSEGAGYLGIIKYCTGWYLNL